MFAYMDLPVQSNESTAVLRSLLKYSNDIIIFSSTEGIISYVSPSVKRIMGYEEEELVGTSGFDLVHPDHVEMISLPEMVHLQPGKTLKFELMFRHKNGSWRWIESIVSNQTHIPGVNAFVSNFRDITEQKETNEKLQYAAALIQNFGDAVIGTDPAHRINSWNKGAEKIYGWKEQEVLGRKASDILHTQFLLPDSLPAMLQELNEKGFWQGEVVQQHKDGSVIPVLASVDTVHDDRGKMIGLVAVNRDITERKKEEQLIRDTKEMLEVTFNKMPAAIYLFNVKGEILFANENAARINGFTERSELLNVKDISVIGKRAMEKYDFEDENGQPFALENSATAVAIRTGKPKQFIFKSISKADQTTTWLLSTASPLLTANGELSMVLSTSTDITLQKQAEKDIRLSEERFRTMAEALPQLVWTTDKNGRHQYASSRWKEYTGLDPLLADTWQQIVHPNDMESVMKVWQDSIKNGKKYQTEIRIKAINGMYRWNDIQGEPVRNEAGEIVKWVGAFTDIHEQKQAEQRIRESEENFQQLADLVPQLVWTARPDGYLDYYNKRWYEYTGFTEEFGDQSWIPILHPNDVDNCIDTWYNSVRTGEPYQIEYRFLDRKNGDYRWFLGKALPIKDEAGVIKKWFGSCTDIHDQKTMTENLERLVKQRTEELERSNEDLMQFAHVTSHDMKEPLRKIQIFGDRLLNCFGNELPETAKSYAEKMYGGAERLHRMIDAILKYSTINSTEERFERVDVNKVLADVTSDLEIAVLQKNASISYTHMPDLQGSPILLYQLFYNLINNSLKFSKEDIAPVITITSSPFGEATSQPGNGNAYAEIVICDNGIGFDQKDAESIFKTFTRLHPNSKYEGTGLGLALCKKIVLRHKGSISAVSRANEGACFKIVLPLCKETL